MLDPDYVSVADYVAARQAGSRFPASRVTPPVLAARLEALPFAVDEFEQSGFGIHAVESGLPSLLVAAKPRT